MLNISVIILINASFTWCYLCLAVPKWLNIIRLYVINIPPITSIKKTPVMTIYANPELIIEFDRLTSGRLRT